MDMTVPTYPQSAIRNPQFHFPPPEDLSRAC
jgi:hypothetical protein